jgi:D-glycero-D-manno-heptose 1,7-bisphosphate phosphatase
MKRVVFLDRDGTMLDDIGYLTPGSAIRLFPWTIDAMRLLRRAGFALVVVTNQGGIARGLYDAAFVETTHELLARRFAAAGVEVASWQYCPHHPDGVLDAWRTICDCRKPARGMIDTAVAALGSVDFAQSWVIGDQASDVELGHVVGARTVLVRTGHGAAGMQDDRWPRAVSPPTVVADHLMAAAARILALSTE